MANREQTNDTEKVSFKDTLSLPRTDFPIRSQASIDDPRMLKKWQDQDLYRATFHAHEGAEKYILHDGPPYANGHLHIGHAYNKILKDIVTKSQRMIGRHVPVTPGWDCHGLPIELKVATENPGLSREELKKACRAYAAAWIDVQREEFKQLGVLMNWDEPYLTMDYAYEATIMRSFGSFVGQGYIQKKNKTVPWCASCQTVLATAEIEYQDRKDPSVYVLFKLEQSAVDRGLPSLAGKAVNLVVWTTTPWTLPLNRAVLLKPGTTYVVLDHNGVYAVVAEQRADALCAAMEMEKKVVARFNADDLKGAHAHHPFIEGQMSPILLIDEMVSLDDGTACVHCAPGCGPQDYEAGIVHGLEIFSPISAAGAYTRGIAPGDLEGMPVADGQIWVLRKLAENGTLFFKTNIKHSYPHCWRCRKGLIFRATSQWFCNLDQHGLKERTLEAIDTIAMVPPKTANHLRATIGGRLEWCLSRQRVWGVPIPAVLCDTCGHVETSQAFINAVAEGVKKEGIEYWDTVDVATLLPNRSACSACGSATLRKEQDILDVWFDSGVSHQAVLRTNPELAFPADVYLEGRDQHRGWFQSSLLTSMVLEQRPPMRMILTHGYTVDGQGRKMSKSLGNGVSQQEVIAKLGTDGLRLWAASISNEGDAVVSDQLLDNLKEVLRKIRVTCRFLLSNLYDFKTATDAVAVHEMRAVDRYALAQLLALDADIRLDYAALNFTGVVHKLADYCTNDLSAFYMDIVKDRLYVDQADGLARRSAQTVCWYILNAMVRLMAPVLSFTAEHLAEFFPDGITASSVHLEQFADLQPLRDALATVQGEIDQQTYAQQWELIKRIRSALLKAIEGQRETGHIKHPLEAALTLQIALHSEQGLAPLQGLFSTFVGSDEADDACNRQTVSDFFKELLIVSVCDVTFDGPSLDLDATAVPGLTVRVTRAPGVKCPRCWKWHEDVHEHDLCGRCARIVKGSCL